MRCRDQGLISKTAAVRCRDQGFGERVVVLSAVLVVCTNMIQVTSGMTPRRGFTEQEQRPRGAKGTTWSVLNAKKDSLRFHDLLFAAAAASVVGFAR